MDPTPLPAPRCERDTALVAGVLAGRTEAFERLMRLHNRQLFRVARSILRDDAEAEDAVQEGYLSAYGALAGFNGQSSLATWLTRIVANEALARLRRRSRRADMSDDAAEPEQQPAPAAETPEALALRRELRRLIEASVDRLPDGCRAVFMLRAVQELSVEETAACLGMSQPAVKTSLFRARALLRQSIGREIGPALDDLFAFDGARCDRLVAGVFRRLGLTAPLPPPA